MPFHEILSGAERYFGHGAPLGQTVTEVDARLSQASDGAHDGGDDGGGDGGGDFHVVLNFRYADGAVGKAALTPLAAAGLLSEIAQAIDRGNRRVRPNMTTPGMRLCDG